MHHGKQEVLKGLPTCAKTSTWHPVLGGFMVDRPGGISLEILRQGPLPQPHTHLRARAVPQDLTQTSGDTKTDAAAADRWCLTAGFLSRVMRGSDH